MLATNMEILKILLACAGGPGTLNSAPRQDFLPLKVKEHNLPLLSDKFLNPLALLWKEIREIMVVINITLSGKDNRCILHMLYDPGNSIGCKLKKIRRLEALFSLFLPCGMP